MKTFFSMDEIKEYGLLVPLEDEQNVIEILKEGPISFDFEMMMFTTEKDEPICDAIPRLRSWY